MHDITYQSEPEAVTKFNPRRKIIETIPTLCLKLRKIQFLQFIVGAAASARGGIEIQSQILQNLNNSFQIATSQLQTVLQQPAVHHLRLNRLHHLPPSPLPIPKKHDTASAFIRLTFSFRHFNKHFAGHPLTDFLNTFRSLCNSELETLRTDW